MFARNFVCLALIAGGLCSAAFAAFAQESEGKPNVPLQKSIGRVTPTGPVPSLFVVNSAGATLDKNKLTMTGVAANSIVFADRPVRAAGHVTTEQFIMQWDEGKNNFFNDPPNGTISVLGGDGSKVEDAVVTLRSPKLEGGNLTFEVSVLEGNLSGSSGPAALFIDRGGFGGFHGGGFGGGGFAGRADFAGRGDFADRSFRGDFDRTGGDYDRYGGDRYGGDRYDYDRNVNLYHGNYNYWHAPYYHGAWYAAPGVGAAGFALGATAAARPWYNDYNYNECGYYPYPPCY
jgi:hypothetical protein